MRLICIICRSPVCGVSHLAGHQQAPPTCVHCLRWFGDAVLCLQSCVYFDRWTLGSILFLHFGSWVGRLKLNVRTYVDCQWNSVDVGSLHLLRQVQWNVCNPTPLVCDILSNPTTWQGIFSHHIEVCMCSKRVTLQSDILLAWHFSNPHWPWELERSGLTVLCLWVAHCKYRTWSMGLRILSCSHSCHLVL